jgi:hypothetical protein
MVKEPPLQMLPLFTERTGSGCTVTVLMAGAELTHPKLLAPLMLYEVVTPGETIALPLLNVYVAAPAGIMVNDLPEQIAPLLTLITGTVLEATPTVCILTQLLASVKLRVKTE